MAFKIELNNLSGVLKKIEHVATNVAKQPELLKGIGKLIRDRIFKITKSGRTMGFNTSQPQKIASLAPVTIILRKWHKKKGLPTGQGFGPAKSNLTYTGQLLDALDYKERPSAKSTKVFVKNSKRTEEGSGPRRKKPGLVKQLANAVFKMNNRDVALAVSRNGRPFVGLDDAGKKQVIGMVKKAIRAEIIKNRLSK